MIDRDPASADDTGIAPQWDERSRDRAGLVRWPVSPAGGDDHPTQRTGPRRVYGGAVPSGQSASGGSPAPAGDPLARMLGRVVADRYELDAVIGRRPAGVAYRAVDRAWRVGDPGRRLVSLTMLDADRGAEPGLAARIDRVAAEVRSLAHPVFDVPSDVVRDGHRLIVVSEHRAGRTLHSLLGGGLGMGWPLRNVLPIGHRIADGLSEAHRAGLAHGGLCLETVLLSADEAVHVLDFGLGAASSPVAPAPSGDVLALARVVHALLAGGAVRPEAPPVRPPGLSEAAWRALLRGLAGTPDGDPATAETFMVSLEDPGWFGRLVRRRPR